MITFDAFLVFLGAVSLPATYIFLLSRWLEPDYRNARSDRDVEPVHAPGHLVPKPV